MQKTRAGIFHLSTIVALHFIVDFVTAGTILRVLMGASDPFVPIVVYNCVAFLLQPFFGLFLDQIAPKGKLIRVYFMSGTLLLLFAGAFLAQASPLFGAVVLGLGNAAFHVLGGKDSMAYRRHKLTEGLFVSSGAVALGLASYLYLKGNANGSFSLNLPYYFLILASIFGGLYILSICRDWAPQLDQETLSEERGPLSAVLLSVAAVLVAVFIRSFQGFYAPSSVEIVGIYVLFISVFAFLGKAVGGLVLEAFGEWPVLILASTMGIVCCFFLGNPLGTYLFVFSCNLLMPLTLDMLRGLFPGKHGFAFGVAAALLVPGWALGNYLSKASSPYVTALITLLAFLLLAFVFVLQKQRSKK